MSRCGAAGSGQRGRRQTGMGGLGSGLADPWVTEVMEFGFRPV